MPSSSWNYKIQKENYTTSKEKQTQGKKQTYIFLFKSPEIRCCFWSTTTKLFSNFTFWNQFIFSRALTNGLKQRVGHYVSLKTYDVSALVTSVWKSVVVVGGGLKNVLATAVFFLCPSQLFSLRCAFWFVSADLPSFIRSLSSSKVWRTHLLLVACEPID